ncbi:MAG: hypothetical protein K2L10_06090 [Ruminococcus sp.]|nr:hypothetical protein [Ruminococcus sp.]
MDIINLIQQKYGDSCQLRSPLNKRQYDKAKNILPCELLEILKISNGINEIMTNPNTMKIEVIDRIVYSLAEIKSQTNCYSSEYGGEGFVFAGNGAGGFFILKPDGKIYIYEYFDLSEEYYAESLSDYFSKF